MKMYPSLIARRELGDVRLNNRKPIDIPFDDFLEEYSCSSFDLHIIEGQDNTVEVPPFAGSFCKDVNQGHILAVADEDGAVILYNTNIHGPLAAVKEWLAHTNAIFDITWLPREKKLLTASGDQTLALWDAVAEQKLDTFKGHTSSVKSVGLRSGDDNVFASGSRDGHIMLWDRRCNKKDGVAPPFNAIRNAHLWKATGTTKPRRRSSRSTPKMHLQDFQQSVTAVVFQDDNTLISCGAVDGCVKVWDIRKNYSSTKNEPVPKHTFHYCGTSVRKHGFTNLLLDSTGTQLFVSCMDDIIYQYNCANYNSKPVAMYRGHQNSTFYVKSCLSPDGRYLLTGSSDYHAYIYEVANPNASPVVLKGHTGEVTSVCWSSTNYMRIATLSDDSTVRFWRGERSDDDSSSRQLLGQACRSHREIGTSASGKSKISPSKHCRGVILSPTKINISRSLPLLPSPSVKYPNLKTWIENLAKKSPRKNPPASPRKLLISPLKGQNMNHHSELPSGRGVKRKQQNENETDSKRLRTDMHSGVNRKPLSPRSASVNVIGNSSTPSRKQLDFDCVDGADAIPINSVVLKLTENINKQYNSPTSNLPNYVLDPKPRVPIGEFDATLNVPSVDWLTQISRKHRAPNESIPSSSRSSDNNMKTPAKKLRTPRISRLNSSPCSENSNSPSLPSPSSSNKTPRRRSSRPSSPSVLSPSNSPSSTRKLRNPASKGNKSILQFFSPVSKKKGSS